MVFHPQEERGADLQFPPIQTTNAGQGCGMKGFVPTSAIKGIRAASLWEALLVVSQRWSFPTALMQG